jgi:hypothetical protein
MPRFTYVAFYDNLIAPPFQYQDFKFTVKAYNPHSEEPSDTKTINVTANVDGGVQKGGTESEMPIEIIEFHVYSDGRIEEWMPKNNEQTEKKVKYLYHENTNTIHEIGEFIIKTIENKYGNLYGGETVDLVDVRDLKNYISDTVYFRLSINTVRYFMNTQTLGSLIGAMLVCSFNDFVFNGFSNEKGESIGGSQSHKNGFNGDFRYLRKDLSGKRVDLSISDETGDPCGWKGMAEERQNQFNDALYQFGWKKMLSWKYDDGRLLNHSQAYKGHNNHLHVQSYKPNYKKLIK